MSYQHRFVTNLASINPLITAVGMAISDMRETWGGNVTCDNDWGEASDLGPWWDGCHFHIIISHNISRKMWPEVWEAGVRREETNQGQAMWDGSNQWWVRPISMWGPMSFPNDSQCSGQPPGASDPLWRQWHQQSNVKDSSNSLILASHVRKSW